MFNNHIQMYDYKRWEFGWSWFFVVIHSDGCFYFRLLGYGLWWAGYAQTPAMFSERYNYVRVLNLPGCPCGRCAHCAGSRVKFLRRGH